MIRQELEADFSIVQVVHGGARGADQIAGYLCKELDIPVKEYPADWKKHGRKAGPIRNQQMLNEEAIDEVWAFWLGSPGTRDMIDRAFKAGILVKVFGRRGFEYALNE